MKSNHENENSVFIEMETELSTDNSVRESSSITEQKHFYRISKKREIENTIAKESVCSYIGAQLRTARQRGCKLRAFSLTSRKAGRLENEESHKEIFTSYIEWINRKIHRYPQMELLFGVFDPILPESFERAVRIIKLQGIAVVTPPKQLGDSWSATQVVRDALWGAVYDVPGESWNSPSGETVPLAIEQIRASEGGLAACLNHCASSFDKYSADLTWQGSQYRAEPMNKNGITKDQWLERERMLTCITPLDRIITVGLKRLKLDRG
jgi:hypothetical protein